jgi:GT2 family glycosyltransferase
LADALVAIIVLNWNGLEDTRKCLASLLQMRGPSPRIYVVDNGSTDGSVEKLFREFGDRMVLLANRRNLLFAGGNNVGIRRALEDGCTHILLLNNDTVVDPEMLAEMMKAGRDDAVLCPKIYYMNRPNVLWYAGGKLNLRRARIAHRGIREIDRGQYDQLEPTDWATGCALFTTRRVYETVGLLDEEFRLYCEDVDFCLRARAARFPIIYLPTAEVWHKVSAAIGGNLSRQKLVCKWNALRRLVRKHIPNPVARAMALTEFVLTEPIRVASALLRGKMG